MNVHPSVSSSLRSGATVLFAGLALVSCERKISETTRGTAQAIPAVAASAVASTAVPATSATSAAALSNQCRQICENSHKLGCKNARECEPNCAAMGSLRPCLETVTALYACLSAQPSGRWECAEDGVAAIREGYCEAEQEHAVGCMEKNLKQ
jgi:hypothetical protein